MSEQISALNGFLGTHYPLAHISKGGKRTGKVKQSEVRKVATSSRDHSLHLVRVVKGQR